MSTQSKGAVVGLLVREVGAPPGQHGTVPGDKYPGVELVCQVQTREGLGLARYREDGWYLPPGESAELVSRTLPGIRFGETVVSGNLTPDKVYHLAPRGTLEGSEAECRVSGWVVKYHPARAGREACLERFILSESDEGFVDWVIVPRMAPVGRMSVPQLYAEIDRQVRALVSAYPLGATVAVVITHGGFWLNTGEQPAPWKGGEEPPERKTPPPKEESPPAPRVVRPGMDPNLDPARAAARAEETRKAREEARAAEAAAKAAKAAQPPEAGGLADKIAAAMAAKALKDAEKGSAN